MRCAKLKGSGARSNGPGEASAEPSCPLRPSKNRRRPPAGCGAEPCCFFPAWAHASEAGVSPCRFFPFPPSHGRSPWVFIRFAEVLVRCLCFHFSTYVVHAVSENHFKLETWAQDTGKLWGLRPQTLSVVRVPRTTEREGKKERMGAIRPQPPNQEQCPWTRSVGASHTRYDGTWAVTFLLGRNGHDGSADALPDPLLLAPDHQWVHRIQTRLEDAKTLP